MLKNAALTGLVMGAVAVVVIFLANPFEGGTPNPTGSFAPVAPLLENPDPAFTVGRGIGAIDAPVVLEVWADFQCPICGQWANNIEPRLYERYVVDGKLRIDEDEVERRVTDSLTDPAQTHLILERMQRARAPRGVFDRGGCLDATRECARWIRPTSCGIAVPAE